MDKEVGEAGVLGSLNMKPESICLLTRSFAEGMKQVVREGGTWKGDSHFDTWALNVRGGRPHGETSARGVPEW